MRTTSSRKMLSEVMDAHVDVACDLLRTGRKDDTGQGVGHEDVLAMTVFLAGVDKTLSLACVFLYIAGVLEKDWLQPRSHQVQPGWLSCGQGLRTKINKLKGMGVLSRVLDGMPEARNQYIHDVLLVGGYALRLSNDGREEFAPNCQIKWSGPFRTIHTPKTLRAVAARVIEELVVYIDTRTPFPKRFASLLKRIYGLPRMPVPPQGYDQEEAVFSKVDELNERHIGRQWERLLEAIDNEQSGRTSMGG